MVAAAQAEEKERQQVQEVIGEVEQHMSAILPSLEVCSDPCKQKVSLLFCGLWSELKICKKAAEDDIHEQNHDTDKN